MRENLCLKCTGGFRYFIGASNKGIFLLSLAIFLYSCGSADNGSTKAAKGEAVRTETILRYGNILDITNIPVKVREAKGMFMDRGSWLGYSLPGGDCPPAGFIGPLDAGRNRYYSFSIVRLRDPSDTAARTAIDTSVYYPGSLYLKGTVGKVRFEQDLYFADGNCALIKIRVKDGVPFEICGALAGDYENCRKEGTLFTAGTSRGESITVGFSEEGKLSGPEKEYIWEPDSRKGAGGKDKTMYAAVYFTDASCSHSAAEEKVHAILKDPEKYIASSIGRWDGYLKKTLLPDRPRVFDRVAVKSVMTLISNWKKARGHLFRQGIIPSHAVGYFNGFWAWDSWKHAAAVAPLEPELAQDQIRAMFDYQNERGMVADCIFIDSAYNNIRNTKSSLAAWAAEKVFETTGDTLFIKEIFPKLVRYYNWWYRDRDRNGNSLCEFGSADGTLTAAKWESGMDNAVRFDKSRIYKINDSAWSFSQESVDLNAFLNFERQILVRLAGLAGERFQPEDHSEKIRDFFYDTQSGYFYDRDMENGRLMTDVQGPEAWIPLWSGLASSGQARGVVDMIRRPDKFSTYIPLPTCARDADGFDPKGYWRGAVWMDQVWFALHGMRNYGYAGLADEYTRRIFSRPEGLAENAPIYENYDPLTGKHAEAPHFSWSAAHLLMLYKEYGTGNDNVKDYYN